MTKFEIQNNKYSLINTNNYNNNLISNLKEIIDNYIYILLNYILIFNQKINIENNNIKFFIFKKGISTINHVFLLVLYYTKNLEVTFYHSQNCYIFYIEFIEQLNFNSSNNIKITVNDAITFVYKKNIYNINNSNINITDQEKQIFKQIEELLKIYSGIIDIFISTNNFNLLELKNTIDNFQNNISLKIKNKNIMNLIYCFLNLLFIFEISNLDKNELLFLFIDEINSRKNINFILLKNNIDSFDFYLNTDDVNLKKIIFKLFN
jgi:hypothetical protein